jgi:hypothetical protein
MDSAQYMPQTLAGYNSIRLSSDGVSNVDLVERSSWVIGSLGK